MINIEETRKKFYQILNSHSSEYIKEWLIFAENRELEKKINKGEKVTFRTDSSVIINENTMKDFMAFAGEGNYALAA